VLCWELGWFDAGSGHLAVLPVLPGWTETYRGREFLDPYVSFRDGQLEVVRPASTNSFGMTMIEAPNSLKFDRWRQGKSNFMRSRVF
jgi:hypothetical protein